MDISTNLTKFLVSRVQFCFRETNRVADLMVHRGHFYTDLPYLFPPYDVDISHFVRKHVLVWPSN